MGSILQALERFLEKKPRDNWAPYPDAAKAIEEFNGRLTQRIAAKRTKKQSLRSGHSEQHTASG